MRIIVPADVPIHRPSVGAMSVASGSRMPTPVKHYVYRGWGYDLLDVEVYPLTPPKPKPKPKKCKPKPPRKYHWDDPRHPDYEKNHLSPPSPEYIAETDRILLIEPKPKRVKTRKPKPKRVKTRKPKPRPEPKPVKASKPLRPSVGWKPTSGVDIDAWMEELGMDD